MKNKFYLFFICLLSAGWLHAQVSDKFIKEAAKKVWATEIAEFDPDTEIPDSITSNTSGVVIAMHYNIKADWKLRPSQSKLSTLGTKEGNYIDYTSTMRAMVKLLDQSAVDLYSDFEFGNANERKFGFHSYYKRQNAFGARIHKPDGTTRDVDVNQALKVAHGKKGNENEIRKIAIPGLEIGDIIEYFYYNEVSADEVPLPPLDFPLYHQYPIMNMMIDGTFDKNLTIEYRTINGVPNFMEEHDVNGKNLIHSHIKNLPAIPTLEYTEKMRQLPYLRLAVINKESRLPHPATTRNPGLYANLLPVTLYSDFRNMLIWMAQIADKNPCAASAKNIFNKYAKDHPEATNRQLVDAAYLSLVYSAMTAKQDKPSLSTMPLMFKKLITQLKLDNGESGIALMTSRSEAKLSDIIVWDEPQINTIVGDSIYFFDSFGTYMPGESPIDMQGEDVVLLMGDLSNPMIASEMFTLGANPPFMNSYTCYMDLSFTDNMEDLSVSSEIKAKGAMKSLLLTPLTAKEFLHLCEDYLGIPQNKRNNERKALDLTELNGAAEKSIIENCKKIQGIDVTDVTNAKFTDLGVMPGSSGIAYEYKGKIGGIVEDMGGDLILNVGKLMGRRQKIDGVERDRKFSAFLPSTMQNKYKITIDTPKGYTPNQESLEQLTININNALGKVFAIAKINSDGNVDLNFMEQYNTFFIPTEKWSDFLELDDVATSIYDTSIIYTKD